MNNLIFNTAADQLLTTVTGTVTVSAITGSVTISNASLTVNGTVTVAEITNPVTIGNTSLTVAGTVTVAEITNPVTIGNTSLTVAGTVTVAQITNPVTIGNTSLTVGVTSYAFTSNVATVTAGSGTGQVFDNTDISNQKVGTFFIYNTGGETLTISLQISPTTTSTYYIDDPSYSSITVAAGAETIMVLSKFANYARLQYTGATSTDFVAYYDFQT
jgi:carbonic anhydrase/acetyltransferase-like protein (isoleucine patch superfamily)